MLAILLEANPLTNLLFTRKRGVIGLFLLRRPTAHLQNGFWCHLCTCMQKSGNE